MKCCYKCIQGLCYKLRMMVITCDFLPHVYKGNSYVLSNTSMPNSVLKKKYSSKNMAPS